VLVFEPDLLFTSVLVGVLVFDSPFEFSASLAPTLRLTFPLGARTSASASAALWLSFRLTSTFVFSFLLMTTFADSFRARMSGFTWTFADVTLVFALFPELFTLDCDAALPPPDAPLPAADGPPSPPDRGGTPGRTENNSQNYRSL